MLPPATPKASTREGMARCWATSIKSPPTPGVYMPLEGSQPKRTVKKYTKIRAKKKPGMLLNRKDKDTTA